MNIFKKRESGCRLTIIIFIVAILSMLSLAVNPANSQSYSWYRIPNSIYSFTPFNDMHFVNAATGWMIRGYGTIFRTTDGGYNWQLMDSVSSSALTGVEFLNESTGWVSCEVNILYKTTNGGADLILVNNFPSPVPDGLQCIHILNSNILYGCGRESSDPTFVKSTNLGESWITRDLSSLAVGLTDCFFINENTGFISGSVFVEGTYRSVVLKTTDGGTSWSLNYQGSRTNEQARRIEFADGLTGYIALERVSNPERYVLKTSNGGLNWHEISFPSYNETSIGFINENTGWIGGFYNPVFGTTDGGTTWFNANIGVNIMEIVLFGDTLGYACGNYVYKYGKTSGIHQTGFGIPDNFEIFQNYPNPFNPSTTVTFNVSSNSFIRLSVYDAIGREVAVLLNERLYPGTHTANFKGDNLTSGIYFIRLSDGNRSETIKALLMK